MLEGGLYYCHYTEQSETNGYNDKTCEDLNKGNTDFYIEEESEEGEGYTGDSMEAAVEYKRKYDKEQKRKAEQQAILKTQTNPQSQSTNWILPVSKGHKITSEHGYRIHPVQHTRKFHDGIDINAIANTPVYAVADGKVFKSEWYNGYGNYIELDHGNGIHSFYGHLNKRLVLVGTNVKQGQTIGLSGNTGIGTGAHLHFGVHKHANTDNPINYLPKF